MLTALFISAAQGQDKLQTCGGCHGADGNSAIPGTPSIAGQPRIFLENYLVLTREGIRGTDVMQALLKGVPDKEIIALSVHFSKLKAKATSTPIDRKLFEKGKDIAARNRCASCHDKTYHGHQQMPRLAGQREEFLAEVMLQYRQNRRRGGDTMMAAALTGFPKPISRHSPTTSRD